MVASYLDFSSQGYNRHTLLYCFKFHCIWNFITNGIQCLSSFM